MTSELCICSHLTGRFTTLPGPDWRHVVSFINLFPNYSSAQFTIFFTNACVAKQCRN